MFWVDSQGVFFRDFDFYFLSKTSKTGQSVSFSRRRAAPVFLGSHTTSNKPFAQKTQKKTAKRKTSRSFCGSHAPRITSSLHNPSVPPAQGSRSCPDSSASWLHPCHIDKQTPQSSQAKRACVAPPFSSIVLIIAESEPRNSAFSRNAKKKRLKR